MLTARGHLCHQELPRPGDSSGTEGLGCDPGTREEPPHLGMCTVPIARALSKGLQPPRETQSRGRILSVSLTIRYRTSPERRIGGPAASPHEDQLHGRRPFPDPLGLGATGPDPWEHGPPPARGSSHLVTISDKG